MIDPNEPRQNPLVVSICGPSNAGKSQLAKATAAGLGDAVASRVPVDYFFIPRKPDVPLDIFFTRPMRWDWELLRRRLALPLGTGTSTPDADFDAFFRRADDGGVPFHIRPVMLADAMEPFPGSDMVVLLNVQNHVRRQRILERDQRWGTRVAERLTHLDATWNRVSGTISPDLVMDGTRPLPDLATELTEAIRQHMASDEKAG